ncbi:citrulline utilization hydrolase CtlX [Lentisalinibacter sediminis]|uniref:citrulline utilization hydrolase CtlX n=1 Tax=Lentisalinibacter sediminis TaxID=2992237 RepID=UPI00386D7021
MSEAQSADAVLMIRPVRFQTNPLTAESNKFQAEAPVVPADTAQERALAEFEGLRAALEAAGVAVHVFDDTPEPHTPDSVFPNNWVSFHSDGTAVVYPMEAPNRRPERRRDVVEAFDRELGYRVDQVIDLTRHEDAGHFLEGTGSLVLDRARHRAYACRSSRTHAGPLGEFARRLRYEVLSFEAVDADGEPIYHTNVMMWVGERMAAVCAESVRDAEQREALLAALAEGRRTVLELSLAQVMAFAGNMLELRNREGGRLLVMSEQARRSLTAEQLAAIGDYARIVSAPLDHIETSAGGSARCMLAAVHLPRR